jgi:hypothetical protein
MGDGCLVKEPTSTLSLIHLSPSFFIVLSIHILSCLMLIHSCIEGIEVCLGNISVRLHALLCGYMPVNDLRGGGVGEEGRNTLSREMLLGSSRRWLTTRGGR